MAAYRRCPTLLTLSMVGTPWSAMKESLSTLPEPEGGYPGNNNAGVVGYPPVNQGPARVYRETEALPGPEYVTGEEYLPEYVARVQ